MPLEETHTAANVADGLEDVVAKFDIPPEKIKAVVHDSGANVVAAVKTLAEEYGWTSVRCADHTLDSVVQSALKNPSDSEENTTTLISSLNSGN